MRKKIAAALAGIFAVCLVISCLTCHGSQGAETERENMKTYRPIPKKTEGTGIYRTKQTVKRWGWKGWEVKEDAPGSLMGSNIVGISGRAILEEGDSLYAAGYRLPMAMELYGGDGVLDWEDYNIYRLKDGKWELFASNPPEKVEDRYGIMVDEGVAMNLMCYGGFLYYGVCYKHTWDEDRIFDTAQFVYRVPIQGGGAEEVVETKYESKFYIYNGKIYYMPREYVREEKDWFSYTRDNVYQEMELGGGDKREIYRTDMQTWGSVFALGGGCLYLLERDDEKKWIIGVNLETGDIRYYDMGGMSIYALFYEDGYLYISSFRSATSDIVSIFRMDVSSGQTEYLADCIEMAWRPPSEIAISEECDFMNTVWLENGYLYFMWQDKNAALERWFFSALDVETKQMSTEVLVEKESELWQEDRGYLEVVGDEIAVCHNVGGEKIFFYRFKANALQMDRLEKKEIRREIKE